MKKMLFQSAMRGEWEEVVRAYWDNPDSHATKISKTGETVLHIAVSDSQEDTVGQLIVAITSSHTSPEVKRVLGIPNKRGNTALHYAAIMGCVRMCERMAKEEATLVRACNKEGETPLLLAVLHGKKDAFICLNYFFDAEMGYTYRVKEDGPSIMHYAITGEYFDLAYQIIGMYGKMVDCKNEQGFTPLHILATKPSSFRSGTHLGWFQSLIYIYIFVDVLRTEALLAKIYTDEENPCYPENYSTCINFIQLLNKAFRVAIAATAPKKSSHTEGAPGKITIELGEVKGATASNQAQGHQLLPSNYETCFGFVKLLSKVILIVFRLGTKTIRKIQEKERNLWVLQIMNDLLKRDHFHDHDETEDLATRIGDAKLKAPFMEENASGRGSASTRCETPILHAAKNGVTEMVERILELYPAAIHDENEEKNLVLLAVENRQPHVYELLLKRNILKGSIFRKVDCDGNSALHLATTLEDYKPWLILGAALQMQWEIKLFNV